MIQAELHRLMAVDRAKLELDQLTERLLASRERPKRQYLIDQIGRIWSPAIPGCDLIRSMADQQHHQPPNRLHHAPTEESIHAVASFSTDPSPYVRTAVAHAFAANKDAARDAISSLRTLLFDSSPIVRITAARTVFQTGTGSLLDYKDGKVLLHDAIWSVRWTIAGALSGTPLRHDAWKALADSIPRNGHFLDCWAEYAGFFKDELKSHPAVLENLQTIMNEPAGKSFGYRTRELMAAIGEK